MNKLYVEDLNVYEHRLDGEITLLGRLRKLRDDNEIVFVPERDVFLAKDNLEQLTNILENWNV